MDRWYRPVGAPVYEFPFSRLLFHRDVWKAVARARAGVVPDEINAAPSHGDIWSDPEACRLFFAIVDTFERDVRARDAVPLLVLIPTKQEMTDAGNHGTPLGIRKIEDYCRSHHYEFVDGFDSLFGALSEGAPLPSLYRKAHLSPEGNRVIADAVFRHLRAHHAELLVEPAG